jgi:uncharacterized repeat protein (TIGR03803 family)
MRQGRRQYRPAVAGLEDRQLLSGSTFSTVATFSGSNKSVISAPVMDAQGDLFGTTSGGGEGTGKGIGTVYEIPAGTDKVTTLASFNGRTGYGLSGVSLDAQENLYATIAGEGGTIGNGSAFEIAKGTTTVTPLASFDDYGGQFPVDGLVTDAQGDHFGTAAIGGADGVASVYEIPAGSQSIVPIANFSGTAPAPKGLVMDAQGNLYGTDQGGGTYGAGSIFEVAKGSNTVTTLATFNVLNGPGISNPTLDAQGDIYGTTEDGGTYGDGTIFEIPKGSNTAVTLATFDGPNGSAPDPKVGVVRDAQGNLFGTTEAGGANGDGTVFEIPAGTDTILTLANFTNTRQSQVTGLLPDGPNTLIGTTDGESGSDGTVFKVNYNPPSSK